MTYTGIYPRYHTSSGPGTLFWGQHIGIHSHSHSSFHSAVLRQYPILSVCSLWPMSISAFVHPIIFLQTIFALKNKYAPQALVGKSSPIPDSYLCTTPLLSYLQVDFSPSCFPMSAPGHSFEWWTLLSVIRHERNGNFRYKYWCLSHCQNTQTQTSQPC